MKGTEVAKIIEEQGLRNERMISGSKSGYHRINPDSFAVFNANIITKRNGKVWWGDLDIKVDGKKLKKAAEQAGTTLYVLREKDARFGSEKDKPKNLIKKAVWDTTQEI